MDESRLSLLETRFDTILPTLATKRDLENLRAELLNEHGEKLHGSAASQSIGLTQKIKWTIILIGALGLAAHLILINEVNKWAAGMQVVATAAQSGPGRSASPPSSARQGNDRSR